jgi:hypothetical protein
MIDTLLSFLHDVFIGSVSFLLPSLIRRLFDFEASERQRELARLHGPLMALVTLAILFAILSGFVHFSFYRAFHPRIEPPPLSPSFNRRMDNELQQAWRELKDGRIAYEPSRTMTEGVPEKVLVRIAQGQTVDAKSGFVDAVWVERLKVSGSMTAHLQADVADFEIVPLGSEEQALVGSSTDWVWQVTPLRDGELRLNLSVAVRIRLSDGSFENHDILVKQTQIAVRANPRWLLVRFWKQNWQWILGSPIILGILAWVGTRLIKRKRGGKRIGFWTRIASRGQAV